MTAEPFNCLRCNKSAIIRWICNIEAKDEVSSDSLLIKLHIQDRIMWLDYIKWSTGWITQAGKLEVNVQKRRSRPKKIWEEAVRMTE